DATTACQRVTQSAYAKLKADWGDDIRIYVIKYRKQANCKRTPFWNDLNTTITFDYSYLDGCASGTSAPYLWDVSDESALKSALAAIAADIKSFANFENAKNVE
ncbi:MAG: hypothetical protein LBQ08_01375, partial [Holosporaceae bacterium]|nr:hypothetical protein [Holosporaceae bacterium]